MRQLVGAANIDGGPLFHVMSGNLGYQVEHHLYPDMPSTRYGEIAPRVREICEQYELPYNTGPLSKQLGMVHRTIIRLAFPGGKVRPKPGPYQGEKVRGAGEQGSTRLPPRELPLQALVGGGGFAPQRHGWVGEGVCPVGPWPFEERCDAVASSASKRPPHFRGRRQPPPLGAMPLRRKSPASSPSACNTHPEYGESLDTRAEVCSECARTVPKPFSEMHEERVTIRQLARLSGVSVGTVSRALNGYTDVNPDTRERIIRLAAELDYTPAAAARSLVTQRSHVIGVVLDTGEGHPDLQHPFFHEVMAGLKNEIGANGFDLLLFASERPGNGYGRHSYLKRARHHNVDGVVVMGLDLEDEEVARLARVGDADGGRRRRARRHEHDLRDLRQRARRA